MLGLLPLPVCALASASNQTVAVDNLPSANDVAFRSASTGLRPNVVASNDAAITPKLDNAEAFRDRMLAWQGALAPLSRRATFSDTIFEAPLAFMRTSSTFGLRADPYLGTVRLHAGVDVPGPVGMPVRASADGIVVFAGVAHGYGNMVELMHSGGLQTRYAHLSRILVSSGEPLLRGSVIGLMGSTGRSTGSHLHFEVRLDGRPINPFAFLANQSFEPITTPANIYVSSPLQPDWANWRSPEPDRLPSVTRR